MSSVVALICSLVIGVSVSLILMAGSQAWTHVSMDFIGFSLSISLVFACLLYLVCAIAPVVPRALIVSFLPLVCALTLKKPFRYKIRKNTPTSVFDLSHYAKRIVVFLGLFYCVFGLSAGMTSVDNMTVFFRGQDAAFLGALLYSLLLVMGGLLLSSQVVTQVLRKSYLIFYVLGLLVFIALPSRFMYLGETFLLVGFIILDNFVWLLQPSIKMRSSKDDYSVFGKSRLVCYGALFVGFVGGYGLTQLPSFTTGNLLVFVCAVSLLTVVVAQTVIMSETAMLDLMEARRNLYEEQPNIEKRCEELASLAKISPRELEVMILLAKGRSYAHIENELFISRNTVKSHVNHIYRKVGVASRQELLDLIYASGVGVNFFS